MLDYSEIWRSVREDVIMEEYHYNILGKICSECLSLPGDMVECGVYRGCSAYLIAKILEGTGKALHLFDTFQGIEKTPDFSDTSLERVQMRVSGLDVNIHYHKGMIQDTLRTVKLGALSFVHLDLDFYDATLHALISLYPHLSPGGIILFDDYGHSGFDAKEAVDLFAELLGVEIERLHEGAQALIRKP